jgi:hypothetical protein
MASQISVDQISPTNPVVPVNITGPSVPTFGGVQLLLSTPNTPSGAAQSAVKITAGTGAPNNADGSNGWIYIRSDGGAGTTIYHKRTGSWIGIV